MYFTTAEKDATSDIRYKARLILNMLTDQYNVYFHLLAPIVSEFERVNMTFQATDCNPEKMPKELVIHYKSLQLRLYEPSGTPRHLTW